MKHHFFSTTQHSSIVNMRDRLRDLVVMIVLDELEIFLYPYKTERHLLNNILHPHKSLKSLFAPSGFVGKNSINSHPHDQ